VHRADSRLTVALMANAMVHLEDVADVDLDVEWQRLGLNGRLPSPCTRAT
jgi:hypothetical protein